MAIPDLTVVLSGDFSTGTLADLSCEPLGDATITGGPLDESFDSEGVTFLQDQTAGSTTIKGFGWENAALVLDGVTRTYEVLFSVEDSTFVVGSTQVSLPVFVIGRDFTTSNSAVSLFCDPWAETCLVRRTSVGDATNVGYTPRSSKVHFAIHHPASPSVSDPVRYYINGVQVWTGDGSHDFGPLVDTVVCGGNCGILPAFTIHNVKYYGVRVTNEAVYPNGDTFTPPTSLPGPVCFDSSSPLRPWHYIPGPMPWFN